MAISEKRWEWLKARAKAVDEQVPLVDLLASYGYRVTPGSESEQQFACDLHGRDNKPSARLYPSTNSFHCFACGKSRGPVAFLRDKEGLTFIEALRKLEKQYGIEVDRVGEPREEEITLGALINDQVSRERVEALMLMLTRERELEKSAAFRLWEDYDRTDNFRGLWDSLRDRLDRE